MSTPLLIRRAQKQDAAALVEFNRAMAQETEGKDLPLEIITAGVDGLFDRPEYGFYLVAELEGEIVGGLMVTFEWSDWRNGLFWWIQSVYIRPAHRQRKIYAQMYTYVKQLAERQGNVCGFRLYVEKENERAQRVYERLGMQETHYKMYEEIKE